ncbi:hypothetical protein AB685_03075 [Bacillus sp. LL01]|nr:hypothetical protein AB685_03075 [Bacillus sp. LL01]
MIIDEIINDDEAIITTTLDSEELFAKSELIINLETSEIVIENLIEDSESDIVEENQYDVYFLTIEGENFRAVFIDKQTGEEIYVNSEEVQASVAPLVVVLATIARYGITRAITKHGATRVAQATVSNAAKTKLPTDTAARELAKELGYKPTNYMSQGAKIFEREAKDAVKGPKFIVRDNTSHIGGVWKGGSATDKLGPNTRSGTYDAVLKRIGD